MAGSNFVSLRMLEPLAYALTAAGPRGEPAAGLATIAFPLRTQKSRKVSVFRKSTPPSGRPALMR